MRMRTRTPKPGRHAPCRWSWKTMMLSATPKNSRIGMESASTSSLGTTRRKKSPWQKEPIPGSATSA